MVFLYEFLIIIFANYIIFMYVCYQSTMFSRLYIFENNIFGFIFTFDVKIYLKADLNDL